MEKLRRSIAGLSLMALLTSLVGFSAIAYAQTFSDVDTDHWAYEYVEDLYAQGVVEGYDDGTYGCDGTANRAEFSKMVALAFGFDTETDYDAGFSDVDAEAWYAPYVNTLAQNGVIAGYTDADGEPTGEFGPGDTVNRAAAAKMLVLAGGLELDTSFGDVFSDVDADAWYGDYINTLYANSVVDGYGDGTFGPADDLSRCALAKMVVGTQNPVARDVEDTEEEDVTDETDTEEEVVVEDSEGTLTVTAGDDVAGGAVPKGATSVEMLNVDLAATTDDIVVSEFVFSRGGVGSSSDFSNVYLYAGNDRLTTGRTVSSSTNTVTFSALNYTVEAGETATLTVVADFSSSATTGNTNYFQLVSADYVTHNGVDIDGDFPLVGSTYTLSGASAGTITIEKYGTLSDPTVGDSGAEVAKFKLTAANEDVWVNRIALRVRGGISSSLISNFTLYYNSTELATAAALNSNDLMVFVLDTPLEIEKGNDKTFTVTADIGAADPADTILVDLDENADLVAVGEVYGFGAQVTSTSYDGNTSGAVTTSCTTVTWDDASCTTLEGGQVTVSFQGPTASDFAVNQDDITVFEFSMTSAIDVEVRKLTFRLYAATTSGDGLYDASSDANYTDIKLIDTDSGATVGSSNEINSTTASGNYEYDAFDYTDIFYVDAGETRNFGIVLDLANNTSLADDTFYVSLETIDTGEGIRDIATGDYVTDIVPGGTVTGNTHTILSSSLSVALASSPASDTIVQGSQDVNSTGFSFTAGKSGDVTITGLTLTGYVNDGGDSTYTAGTDNSLNLSSVVSSVELYDGNGNKLSTNAKSFSTGGSTLAFTGLDWDIAAGTTEKLVVVADVFKYAVSGANDGYAFDIASASSVTAIDEDGRSLTATASAPNGATSPTVAMTVKNAGKITVATSSDPVLDTVAVAGEDLLTDPLLVARFQIYATDEAFLVDEMQFTGASTLDAGAVEYVLLKYPTSTSAPDTLDGSSQVSVVDGKANFDALAVAVPVSEDSENAVEVELYVVTNEINDGATSGDTIRFDFDYSEGFSADGVSSGTTVTSTSGTTLFGTTGDVTTNETVVYRDVPVFATDTSDTNCPSNGLLSTSSEKVVYCFSVTTDGPVALYQLTFDATPSLVDTGSGAGDLALANGWKVYDLDDLNTQLGQGTWSSTTNRATVLMTVADANGETVNNTTKYYVVKAPVSMDSYSTRSVAASLSVRLAAEPTTITDHVAPATASAAADASYNVWSDKSASDHDASKADWMNTYRFTDLPTSTVDLSESF